MVYVCIHTISGHKTFHMYKCLNTALTVDDLFGASITLTYMYISECENWHPCSRSKTSPCLDRLFSGTSMRINKVKLKWQHPGSPIIDLKKKANAFFFLNMVKNTKPPN